VKAHYGVPTTRSNFPAVYLLHGMGGSPEGSVRLLQIELEKCEVKQNYVRPLMPHANPNVPPSESVEYLRSLNPPQGALIVGISMGGLVAAKLQELDRPDLHVIGINSPTHAGDTELLVCMKHRVSLYCSGDMVISGRTERWPQLAEAYDLPWLTGHDTDKHKRALAFILRGYLEAGRISWELEHLDDAQD
jgi:pimeloyl-ACP methyl ester carboxylesterase